MLRLIPFNPVWIGHDKLDLRAIYRRPRWKDDAYGEPVRELDAGLPAWDLTGPLPVKHHNKWLAKGFEYVTLADANSLMDASKKGALLDEHGQQVAPREFMQDPKTNGPWNYRKYAEDQSAAVSAELAQIRDGVIRYGSAAYEGVRQGMEPGFTLPAWLRGFEAGDDVPLAPPAAVAPVTPAAQPVAPASEMSTRGTSARPRRRKAVEVVAK